MSSLSHHGIKGQRWGVRRFQNKDGTLTREGQIRFAKKNLKHAKVRNLDKWGKSPDSNVLYIIGTSGSGKSTTAKGLAEDGDQVIHLDTIFEKENHGSPDRNKDFEAFLKENNVDISKTSDFSIPREERWKTYDAIGDLVEAYGQHCFAKGSKVVIEGVQMGDQSLYPDKNYFNGKPTVVLKGNIVRDTFRADRRDGVPLRKTVVRLTDKERWNWYKQVNATANAIKYTSIGGNMYLEGNALILGDSSYLEHHGIRGQRWGVRRFQNRDGSLTNAGRKRLGYATKGAAQAVGKAFKAGVKVGGNAVKAAKAHHEKKEAEKLQKKKEKASKTRLGVMANKDLFTNEEIRKLNERFKLEDEMKMATLQKGVEIAKAVGTIAQNVGTVAKTYEDVTGQSLSPIKRKAAEEKARQDKEDRERRIAREDADEARKAAKEERDIAIHEQTLRKAIASADTQEFTAQKTKAEADSSILDLYKKGQDYNGGSDATGQSWVEKAKNGGKNPFDDMIANRDPEYAQIRKEHDEKVARKERIAELERREKEREAEKAAASKKSAPQQKQGGGDDDALFSQKGSLPIDKDRYRNNRAMEKAKQVKDDAAEERAKKQDEKAVNRTIDDTIEANRSFKEVVRAQDPHAYDRGVAKDYIKGKLNNLPNALADLNPINRAAKKIADKATKEEEAQVRKSMKDQYDQMVKNEGRDEANYVMYNTRVANLQAQGYSERKAKQIADSNPTFSAKRNRKKEYYEKVGELESTHRKNAEELHKANKELTDYYYKLVNGPGYDPGTPKREALDRTYRQKRGELERLEKDNNEMLEKGTKEAKKILEHSFSIQNGVLFIDSSDGLTHHGVKGQRWGVRRFQNADGSLTDKGRKHYEKAIAKIDRMQTHSDARRGRLERQHPFAVTGAAIAGAIAAGLSIAATGGASVAAIAAGSAISSAVSAGITHASYSVNEAWEGRGTKHRQKKRKEYEEMLNHDGLIVLDGTLYLEHHGIRGQKWGVRRFQNADGTRTALGKKREMYGATVSVHGHKSSESVGVTKKQAKGKAAAEILKNSKDLSEKERKKLQKHVDRAEKETAKLEKYKEKKKREQERNTEESKVRAWQALGSGVISPDKYKQNIDAINKNHKREIDYLNKMDERDMANEKAFTRKTVAKGMGYAVAATAGLAGITAATTGWMVISGYAAVGGGMVGAISGEMKRAQYREERRKEMGIDAKHDAFSIQNGTLFINAGEPYLEHHGVKGMKWGKHLMAGKGVDAESGGGGGFAEDDEKLKEMAKKAGMSVAEYRTKMASKLSGAANEKKRLLTQTSAEAKKVSVKDKHLVINRSGSSTNAGTRSGYQILPEESSGAARPKAERKKITRKDVGEALYNIAGGNAKKAAQEHHRNMVNYKNEADKYSRDANIEGSAAKAHKRAGNVSAYVGAKTGARVDEENAKNYRLAQYSEAEAANKAQKKYDRSLAGLYDKATGKYKQVHKQTKTPSLSKQYQYYTKDVNGKLFDHGKPKTAKERAKAEVWNAADYRIKAQDYYNQSFDPTNTAYGYDTAYRKAAVDQGRLAEGAYRRAAALGKQASSETSTSSRPRARKKKHTSGGSGVTVRRPGRKPVSRTKRVTQSSTGVKRRGSTGSGRTVRRGA